LTRDITAVLQLPSVEPLQSCGDPFSFCYPEVAIPESYFPSSII